MKEQIKLFFHVQQDEDGFPGVGSESVWAIPTEREGLFTVDNIPFFATDANLGDVVSVTERDGVLWFREVVTKVPLSLVRIVFFNPEKHERVSLKLKSFGCQTEYWAERKLLSVSVPRKSLPEVQAFLESEASLGSLDYEEPIIRE
ncbi:DUF4265 domain-containing protein [Xanthomonas sp. NCPPB 2632]|uniref:DUF4265 domain-containing protein n=1 Tax=Xanthomonas sp. NCPPB 2632 TaxID=3240912 RepID=UPI00351295CA